MFEETLLRSKRTLTEAMICFANLDLEEGVLLVEEVLEDLEILVDIQKQLRTSA